MNIDLPWPDKYLWPNGPRTRNHGHRAAVVAKHRDWARIATLGALQGQSGYIPSRIVIRVHAKPRGPLPDRDNCIASLKPGLDGIADGLKVNDRDFPTPEIEFADTRDGRFVVVLHPPRM